MLTQETINQLITLANNGGSESIQISRLGDLALFNYVQTNGIEWGELELICRGLILNIVTGEIVARPFDKFFNWGEGGRYGKGEVLQVREKLDGSLGIMYRHNNEVRVATRNSFESEQAKWATQWLNEHLRIAINYSRVIPDEYTLIFEIIYPKNRVVISYGNRAELVLLAIRNRFTGEYIPYKDLLNFAAWYGFGLPIRERGMETPNDILARCETLDGNHEGYVVLMSDGSRWKFKSRRYLELHKSAKGLSRKSVIKPLIEKRGHTWLKSLPEEFVDEMETYQQEYLSHCRQVSSEVDSYIIQMPLGGTKKDSAMWIKGNVPKQYQHYLFTFLSSENGLLFDDFLECEANNWQ